MASKNPYKCSNGHLIFHHRHGSGCLEKKCPHYVNPKLKPEKAKV
jgi:hypothetical protein